MRLHVFMMAVLVACSGPKEASTVSFSAPATSITATNTATPVPSASASATTPSRDEDPFTRVRDDLTACYEEGKKAVPTMTSGRITFHVSVDASGKTACVVPSDDTGLTQEVENCMRTRLDKESYAPLDTPWSFSIPLVLKEGKLGPGETRRAPSSIETIESHGLAEDVYDVIDGLLPDLYGCVKGISKSSDMRVIYVGARVGSGGSVECALASAPTSIPSEARTCTTNVFARAKFRAPKKGYGLVSVPLNVMPRK